ncbi:M60 family metallopeptidase [Streptomyces luteireticuli]|uniref:M60 family metallopeptidase n=1 Tax=Streptomyces luteireticuli TaxID=173858 RepID=A0ABN0Z0P9_9ACTN
MTRDNSPKHRRRTTFGRRTAFIAATVLAAVVGTTAATTAEAVAAPVTARDGDSAGAAAEQRRGARQLKPGAFFTPIGLTAKLPAKPSPGAEQQRLKSMLKLSSAQSTGLYLPPQRRSAVIIDDTPESRAGKVKLHIGVPGAKGDGGEQRVITLEPGSNILRDGPGGMLYLSVEGGSSASITLETLGIAEAPRFVLGRTSNEEFRKMLDRPTNVPWVEYVSERTVLTVDRATALKYRDQDQKRLMESYETITRVQDAVNNVGDGKTRPSPLVQHITLDSQKTGATDGQVAFDPAYADVVLSPGKLAQRLGPISSSHDKRTWDVWKELGRHRQLAPLGGDGFGEATVSLYATAVERHFSLGGGFTAGITSKLSRTLAGLRKADPSSVDVQRAVMFDQLRLAYGPDFWPKVNDLAGRDKPRHPRGAQDNLILMTSVIAGEDLRDFFAKSKMFPSKDAAKVLDKLDLRTPKHDPSAFENGRPKDGRVVGLGE